MATRMTREEIYTFLDEQRTVVLVTLRENGWPVAHPLWFVRVGEAIYINTRSDSAKLRHVLADDRVCAVVEAGEGYFELRGVRLEGRCRTVEDAAEIARVHAAQAEKDERIGSGMEEMPEWFSGNRARRAERGDRVMLRLPMERVYSWDFSKVRRHYGGAGTPG